MNISIHWKAFVITLISFAAFVLFYNIGSRSMWGDELWVAEKIVTSLRHIFTDNAVSSHYAPRLFLAIIHVITLGFGTSEFVLRFLPALFGLLSIIFLYLLTKKVTNNNFIALLSVSLLAFNLRFIQYANELKQYSGEFFFTVLIFYFTEIYISRKRDLKFFFILCVVSVVGIFLFFPTIVIVATVAIRLFLLDLRDKKNVITAAVFSLLALFVFAFDYVFLIPKPNEGIYRFFWWLFPNSHDFISLLSYILRSFYGLFQFLFLDGYQYFGIKFLPAIFLVLFMLGLIYIIRTKQYSFLIYFFVPVFMAALGGLLRKYPFGATRLDLYLTPLIFTYCASGLFFIINTVKNLKVRNALLVLMILISPISFVFYNKFIMVNDIEQIREVILQYKEQRSADDMTYVYWASGSGVRWYYGQKNMDSTFYKGSNFRSHPSRYKAEMLKFAAISKGKRAWLIFQHDTLEQEARVKDEMFKYCKLLQSDYYRGASLFLFQC